MAEDEGFVSIIIPMLNKKIIAACFNTGDDFFASRKATEILIPKAYPVQKNLKLISRPVPGQAPGLMFHQTPPDS